MMRTKCCSTCKQLLSLAEFSRNRCLRDGYQNVCNRCKHDYYNRWYRARRADPDWQVVLRVQWKERSLRMLLKRFGLTRDQYLALVARGCAICGGLPNGRWGSSSRYAFDHDHRSGVFRGLLCSRCNHAIGLFGDKPSLLIKALEYLGPRFSQEGTA